MQKDSDDEARVNLSHSCHTLSHDNHMLVTLEPQSYWPKKTDVQISVLKADYISFLILKYFGRIQIIG